MSGAFFDVACIALINEEGDIIGQLRDNKPGINAPGKVGCFGGYIEPGETAKQAVQREIREETNLRIAPDHIELFGQVVTGSGKRFRQNVFIAKGISGEGLQIYEGQRAYVVRSANDEKITSVMRFAAQKWFAERDRILHAVADTGVHRFAATFFVGPDGTLYGQLRDNKPGIDQPGKIGGFGGACEAGETPRQTALRELHEETNGSFTASQLELLKKFVVWRPLTREYEQATIYLIRNFDPTGLQIFEGQGVTPIPRLDNSVSVAVLPALRAWFGA